MSAKTHTGSVEWKEENFLGVDLMVSLAHRTGERGLLEDQYGNPIAAIISVKDLERLEKFESEDQP